MGFGYLGNQNLCPFLAGPTKPEASITFSNRNGILDDRENYSAASAARPASHESLPSAILHLSLLQGVLSFGITLPHRYLAAEFNSTLFIDPNAFDPDQIANFHHIIHALDPKIG